MWEGVLVLELRKQFGEYGIAPGLVAIGIRSSFLQFVRYHVVYRLTEDDPIIQAVLDGRTSDCLTRFYLIDPTKYLFGRRDACFA